MLETCLDWLWRNGAERVSRFRWGDLVYSVLDFRFYHGYFPNLARPHTFSEHMLRLKLSAEILDPMRQFVTDKEHVKTFVRATIGDRYNVPTCAVLRSIDEIDAFVFPSRCMIKATHASGMRMLRRQVGDNVDRAELKTWLAQAFYPKTREAHYRCLTPKIIVEDLLLFDGRLPLDYKIHCFSGRPKLIHVMPNRLTNKMAGPLYTPDWEKLPFELMGPAADDAPRPKNLDEILDVARRLSAAFSYIRVDLYTDGRWIFIGELTSVPANAKLSFRPALADALTARFFEDPDRDPADLYAALRTFQSEDERRIFRRAA
jgi:hypothetical protein